MKKNYNFAELHCHIDGSVLPETFIELSKKRGEILTAGEAAEILKAPKVCDSLVDYLKRFESPLSIMQNKDNITRITYEVFKQAADDGLSIIEPRFAPDLHTSEGLLIEEVIEAAVKGVEMGVKDFGVDGSLILCGMKNLHPEKAVEMVKAAKNYLGKGVCAIDYAGPENLGFAGKFIKSADLAKEYGFNITVHAGEVQGPFNIMESIRFLNAQRIGHGIRAVESEECIEYLVENRIPLEVCPTSNVQTTAVSSIEKHPVKELYDRGVIITLSTDNRTVSDTTVKKEISILENTLGFKKEDIEKIAENTMKYSFLNVEGK